MFLMDGWRAVFRIGIALLREMESVLLTMDMVEMSTYFRENVRKEQVASNFRLFSSASRVRVNPILVYIALCPYLLYLDPQQGAGKAEGAVLHHLGGDKAQVNSSQLGKRSS